MKNILFNKMAGQIFRIISTPICMMLISVAVSSERRCVALGIFEEEAPTNLKNYHFIKK